MDCIFCKLANGEIPTNTVYEDENFRVILDAAPANKGHSLVIPKKHALDIFELDEESVAKAHAVAKKVAYAVKTSMEADGVNILQNNGEAAGQTVSHYHIHVIPRFKGDWQMTMASKPALPADETEAIRKKISDALQ